MFPLGVVGLALLGCAELGPEPNEARLAPISDLRMEACDEAAIFLEEVQAGLDAAEAVQALSRADLEVLAGLRADAVRSATETLDDDERAWLQDGLQADAELIERLAWQRGLTEPSELRVRLGLNAGVTVELPDLRAESLGVDTGSLDMSTSSTARAALPDLDEAIVELAHARTRAHASRVVLSWHERRLVETLEDCWDEAVACSTCEGVEPLESVDVMAPSIQAAQDNREEGRLLVATASEASQEALDLLGRIRALLVTSEEEGDEHGTRQVEFEQLSAGIDRLAAVTEFGGVALTDGTNPTLGLQIGLEDDRASLLEVTLGDLRATVLGVDTGSLEVRDAESGITAVDTALDTARSYLSDLQAVEERLQALEVHP
jgi:hypothetical protein